MFFLGPFSSGSYNYTPEQQIAYEKMIADRYEVEPSYFADKYGMPVGERRQQTLPPTDKEDDNEEEGDKRKNSHPFFD